MESFESQFEPPALHPLALRILEGESVSMCEISMYNAKVIMDWYRRGEHDADTCHRKHCQHGAQPKDIEHAAKLASHVYCCGGTNA